MRDTSDKLDIAKGRKEARKQARAEKNTSFFFKLSTYQSPVVAPAWSTEAFRLSPAW